MLLENATKLSSLVVKYVHDGGKTREMAGRVRCKIVKVRKYRKRHRCESTCV